MAQNLRIHAITPKISDWTCKIKVVDICGPGESKEKRIKYLNMIVQDKQDYSEDGGLSLTQFSYLVDVFENLLATKKFLGRSETSLVYCFPSPAGGIVVLQLLDRFQLSDQHVFKLRLHGLKEAHYSIQLSSSQNSCTYLTHTLEDMPVHDN